MMAYLPTYERKSKVFQEIMNAAAKEVSVRHVDMEDLKNQFFIHSATWGLSVYEQELGIPTDVNKSYEERRNVIIAKWRGIGKVDKKLIQLIAESYAVGDVLILFNHAITIYLLGVNETMLGVQDLLNTIEEIKPAHLRTQIIYVYITYGELSPSTYGNLESLTYRQIKIHDF
jgi:hypothetical protein